MNRSDAVAYVKNNLIDRVHHSDMSVAEVFTLYRHQYKGMLRLKCFTHSEAHSIMNDAYQIAITCLVDEQLDGFMEEK